MSSRKDLAPTDNREPRLTRRRKPRWPVSRPRASVFEPIGPHQVKLIRTRLGLSQKRFAEEAFVHEATVRNWELGRCARMRLGSIITLRKLAASLTGAMAR